MKKSNILLATSTVALLATGCVKPVQENQPIYGGTTQPTYTEDTQQSTVYEGSQSTVYQPSSSGVVYEDPTTIIPTGTTVQQPVGSVTTYPDTYGTTTQTTAYPDTYGSATTTGTTSYPDTYGSATTTATATYPDPYANGGSASSVYTDTYSSPAVTNYPTTSSSAGQSGGIQLQIAALKDYSMAEDYKNRLSLAPGLSAYVQRGAMNKVIVTGIPSRAEANRLKESRFPGAFIVHGGTSSSYTPAVQPNYSTTSGGAYNVNNPYGTSSSPYSSSATSGVGVQIGAFGSRGKAQSVANSQSGKYPATVKKIGRYYKVILTGFSSRSAAKSYAGRIGGFVVNY